MLGAGSLTATMPRNVRLKRTRQSQNSMVTSTASTGSVSRGRMRIGLGMTFDCPMKNDSAAMKSANDMRHRCLMSRDAPRRAPDLITRRSPTAPNSPITPNMTNGDAVIPSCLLPPCAIASNANARSVTPTASAASVVPRWVLALPGVQRRYVLRHEEEHRRSHDSLLLFVASLGLILTPWNLALWWQLRRLRLAVEMDCDNRVVSALGDANAYGELLFKVAQAASRGPRLQPAFLGAGLLECRLTALLAPAPVRQAQRFLLPVAAGLLLLLVLSMPHPVLVRSSSHAAMTSASKATPPIPHTALSAEVVVPRR